MSSEMIPTLNETVYIQRGVRRLPDLLCRYSDGGCVIMYMTYPTEKRTETSPIWCFGKSTSFWRKWL